MAEKKREKTQEELRAEAHMKIARSIIKKYKEKENKAMLVVAKLIKEKEPQLWQKYVDLSSKSKATS